MRAVFNHPSSRWILGAVVAYCLLLLATTAEAQHRNTKVSIVAKATSPGANPDGSRDSITLFSEQGDICPPNSKRAVYFIGKTKTDVEGCYVIREDKVHVGFVDGDSGVIPMSAFEFVGGAPRPQAAPPSGNDAPGVGPGRDTNGTPKRVVPIEAVRGGARDA